MENSEIKENLNSQVSKSNKNHEFFNEQNSILEWFFIQEIEKRNLIKAICKLEIIDSTGTGFFCEIPSKEMKVLITSNHLIEQNF